MNWLDWDIGNVNGLIWSWRAAPGQQYFRKLLAVLRIRNILVRIRIRLQDRILRFLPVAFKMPTKISDFAMSFWRYIYISLQRKKVMKKSQNSRNPSFITFIAWWWKDTVRIRTNNDGSGWLKNLRILWIQVRNTGSSYFICTYIFSVVKAQLEG